MLQPRKFDWLLLCIRCCLAAHLELECNTYMHILWVHVTVNHGTKRKFIVSFFSWSIACGSEFFVTSSFVATYVLISQYYHAIIGKYSIVHELRTCIVPNCYTYTLIIQCHVTIQIHLNEKLYIKGCNILNTQPKTEPSSLPTWSTSYSSPSLKHCLISHLYSFYS